MLIDAVEIRDVSMMMKEPFETSFGVEQLRHFSVVRVFGEGHVGFGECVAAWEPFYNEETAVSSRDVLERFLLPAVLGREIASPHEIAQMLSFVRRNYMAKSALETAVWDLFGHYRERSLAQLVGGTRAEIAVGISIGIQPSISALVAKVGGYLEQGFRRIKIKIKPGSELEPVAELRRVYGDIALMVDANSAYRLSDVDLLRRLDPYGLMMIEQPLGHDDLYEHAELAKMITTPICLDESICTLEDLKFAHRLGACGVVNLKVPRVGGLSPSVQIANYCSNEGIDLWCGGSLESGIGRLANVAIASLEGFTLPGDTAPSERYFERDLLVEPVRFSAPGTITVPNSPGLGGQVDMEYLEEISSNVKMFRS